LPNLHVLRQVGTEPEGEAGGGRNRSGAFELGPNYPNPSKVQTLIPYQVPQRSKVELRICNIAGQLVRRLVGEVVEEAGRYTARWDGRDETGQVVGSGVHLFRMSAGGFVHTRRLTLIK